MSRISGSEPEPEPEPHLNVLYLPQATHWWPCGRCQVVQVWLTVPSLLNQLLPARRPHSHHSELWPPRGALQQPRRGARGRRGWPGIGEPRLQQYHSVLAARIGRVALSVQLVSLACGGFTVAWRTNRLLVNGKSETR
jgi:hypothetical protein